MRLGRIASLLTALALSVSVFATGCSKDEKDKEKKTTTTAVAKGDVPTKDDGSVQKELTALELVKEMGNGINLGNTMEAYGHGSFPVDTDTVYFETLWGQPETSERMIQGMKDAGFDSIRIPVAWTNAMDYENGDYTIQKHWMDRVETIVNYALDADMYVVINDHWDGGWWGMFGSATPETREKAMDMYVSMWEQIADRFQNYSDKLIFEAGNEELGDRLNDKDKCPDSGSLNKNECYETTNLINQTFVDTIRKSGGNNADRFLLIAGYNTDIMNTCDDRFKMPTDTAKDKLLISVHYYTPWDYCGTDSRDSWGSVKDYEEQNSLMEMMTKFTDQGYGVIIGEYAVLCDNGKTRPDTDKFYTNFLDNCDLYNYCPMLWDCSSHYIRREGKITDSVIADLFSSRSYAAQKDMTDEEIKKAAKDRIDATVEEAGKKFEDENAILPADDKAVAWIMYSSGDWGINYCVGDEYDPTSRTGGVIATNVEVTGEGTYTIELNFEELGGAYGTSFSAIGLSNGESLFPGYCITIDEVLINGEKYELEGKPYTSSDDGKCTRVNLYNAWVPTVPEEARVADGDLTGCTPTPLDLNKYDDFINTITITFTFSK